MKHDEHPSEETINLYLDGELDDSEWTRVEAHLTTCAACRAEVEALQELFTALDEMADAPAPNMAPGVVARIRPRRWRAALRWTIPALQGAAAAGLLAWGWVRLTRYLTVAAHSLPLEALETTEAKAMAWMAARWSTFDTWSGAAWAQVKAQFVLGLPFAGLDLPVAGLVITAILMAIMWLVGNALLLGRIMYSKQTAQPV
jgi:anti-sigma factor RsiW